MFQLIIGVLLGIILLFVIVLLITEVGSTYPVWRQGEKGSVFNDQMLSGRERRNPVRIFLLIIIAIAGLGIAIYLVSSEMMKPKEAEKLPATVSNTALASKILTGTSSSQSLVFRLQTKWEDGKLYGNNTINFRTDSAWRFTDCRYHLLDNDGFLVKEIIFLPDDFVYITRPDGRITGISNKFNAEISLKEYQKIEKMQVVLDKKLVHLTP